MVVLATVALGSASDMSISSCLCKFSSRWVANEKAVSSGIWA